MLGAKTPQDFMPIASRGLPCMAFGRAGTRMKRTLIGNRSGPWLVLSDGRNSGPSQDDPEKTFRFPRSRRLSTRAQVRGWVLIL